MLPRTTLFTIVANELGRHVSERVRRAGNLKSPPTTSRRGWYNVEAPSQTLQLLLACRQIHQEAIPVYYALNKFMIHNQYKLCEVLGALSADRLRKIKNMEVGVCWHHGHRDNGESMRTADPTIAASVSLNQLRICHDDNCIYSRLAGPFRAPEDYADVDNMEFITALALRAKEVDTFVPCVEDWRNWTVPTNRKPSDVFHQFILGQVQQAGSNAKVTRSLEGSEVEKEE